MALTTRLASELALDPRNPRLPEDLQGVGQAVLLEWLYENGVLEELMRSMADNGFFEHEPLIVADEETDGFPAVALEGNRRVAALKILLSLPPADSIEPPLKHDVLLTPERRVELLGPIPCYVVARAEVHRYLGFRHIGGIKTWDPEAKARYIYSEVERAREKGATRPFLEVARAVGSNSQGIRNSYLSLAILRVARDEMAIDVSYVLRNRFGVWLRCMTSSELRAYIGFPTTAREYEDVQAQFRTLIGENLAEVVGDLSPGPTGRPVLADSRDVTTYARVLSTPRAHDVLRRSSDLALAGQVVEELQLPHRISRATDGLKIIFEEVQRAALITPDIRQAVDELWLAARSIEKAARPDA